MTRRPVLIIENAGFGETPVPSDAIVVPGQELQAHSDEPGYPMIRLKCLAVVPVGVPIEYAMADQAEPKQPRPLMLPRRRARKETVYVLLREGADEPEIFPHSVLNAGQARADDMRERGELPPISDAAT